MTTNQTLFKAIAIAMSPALAATSAAAQETILFNCFWGPSDPICAEAMPEMQRRIEEATQGRVTLSVPAQSLTAPPDQHEGVRQGVMDAAISYGPFLQEVSYGIHLPNLPFVGGQNGVAGTAAFYDTYEEFFEGQAGEMDDFVVLSVYVSAGSNAYSTTEDPIVSVEDLSGRKIFATPGAAADLSAAAGAAVVTAPAVQMAEFVTRGVVDGYMLGDWATIDGFKLGDYTTHVTTFERPLQQGPFMFYIGRERFESFSEEDQVAIKDALGRDFSMWVAKLLDEDLAELAFQYAPLIPETTASAEFEAELTELAEPIVQQWVDRVDEAGFNGRDAIDFFQQRYAEEFAELQ